MKIEEFETLVEVFPAKGRNIKEYSLAAYNLLKDMPSFPDYMKNVLNVTQSPLNEFQNLVKWECLVDEVEFNWEQKTSYHEGERKIKYEITEGDFEIFEGEWEVKDYHDKLDLRFYLKYSIGLPVIEDVLGPILKEKLELNSHSMLNDIKYKLENLHGDR